MGDATDDEGAKGDEKPDNGDAEGVALTALLSGLLMHQTCRSPVSDDTVSAAPTVTNAAPMARAAASIGSHVPCQARTPPRSTRWPKCRHSAANRSMLRTVAASTR